MTLPIELIRKLPKAELHCHLDGFCRPSTIVELAKEQGVKLMTDDFEELKRIMTAPPDCPDLVTYLQCFDAPLAVMQYPYAITRIFYEACEDAVKDGITYLELRFAPALHVKNGHSYSQILQAAIDGIHMAESRLPITVRIICCGMRHMSPEENKAVADVCWRFRHSGVVAYDLAGPEYGFRPDKHIEAFRTMREKSVAVTIHAGEAFGAKSVELALACNANRIGHGTRIVEDEKVLQTVIDRRIPIEMCVSSNVQTKAITKIEDHPIKTLFQRGIICVPCTDNPTVSGVTLTGEYAMLQDKFGFNVEELVRMMDYGFRSAFVDENLKRRLRIEAITRTIKILQEENIDISTIVANAKYYTSIGLSVPNKFSPPVKIPDLTLEMIKTMKKADCDVRFIGSVPLEVLYQFYVAECTEQKIQEIDSFEMFKALCVEDPYHSKAKETATKLLQTEDRLRDGMTAILKEAISDNVRYMEIAVNPLRHTLKGLKCQQVLDILNETIAQIASPDTLIAHLVICANIDKDSPLEVQMLAELCVEYQEKNVVGFSTITTEISPKTMIYFQSTFDFLREHHVSVSMFAGEKDSKSIPIAIVRGNARRISGAFQVTNSCALLNEITSHGINVLAAPSARMSAAVDTCFSKHPIRSFFDFGVKVAFCSIHNAFTLKTRSEQLYDLAISSGFNMLDMIKILHNTFGSAFLHYHEIKELQNEFWNDSISQLKTKGFERFLIPSYFKE